MKSIILALLFVSIAVIVECNRGGERGGRGGNGGDEDFISIFGNGPQRFGNGGRFGGNRRRPNGQTRQLVRSIEGLIRQLDAQQTRFANNTEITSSIASNKAGLTQLLQLIRNNTSTSTTSTTTVSSEVTTV